MLMKRLKKDMNQQNQGMQHKEMKNKSVNKHYYDKVYELAIETNMKPNHIRLTNEVHEEGKLISLFIFKGRGKKSKQIRNGHNN